MKIVAVDPFYLRMPGVTDAADGTQDSFLVRVRTDNGLEGWGESDASPLVSLAVYCCPMSHGNIISIGDSLAGETLESVDDIRRLHAKKEDPVAAILSATGGRGCDVVVDAAGTSPARQQGLKVTARGGVLAFVGLSDPATEMDVVDIINRELEIHGIYGYAPADYERALEVVAAGRIDVTSWVREFPLEDGPRVMDQLTTAPGDLVKASLTP